MFKDLLSKLSEHADFCKHADSRIALAQSAVDAGFTNRRAAVKNGMAISRRTWKSAKHGGQAALAKRGRPSLVSNPDMQKLVAELAEANSRESSYLMTVKDGAESCTVAVRHWSVLPFHMYLQSEKLINCMSYDSNGNSAKFGLKAEMG
jgi:transposase